MLPKRTRSHQIFFFFATPLFCFATRTQIEAPRMADPFVFRSTKEVDCALLLGKKDQHSWARNRWPECGSMQLSGSCRNCCACVISAPDWTRLRWMNPLFPRSCFGFFFQILIPTKTTVCLWLPSVLTITEPLLYHFPLVRIHMHTRPNARERWSKLFGIRSTPIGEIGFRLGQNTL